VDGEGGGLVFPASLPGASDNICLYHTLKRMLMNAIKEPERINLAEGLALLERHVPTEEAKSSLRQAFIRKAFPQSPLFAFEYDEADIDWTTGSVKIPRVKERFYPTFLRAEFSAYFIEDHTHAKQTDFSASATVSEEWISAATALALLGMNHHFATGAICKRAHAGLIKARAARFIRSGKPSDNVDVPSEFWWARGGGALIQNWVTGDFETWIDQQHPLEAFGVTFRRSEIEEMITTLETSAREAASHPERIDQRKRKITATGKTVFIGHGGSLVWRELKDFLRDRLDLSVEEFNSVAVPGMTTVSRLEEMLESAAFAFLIMTAEDEQPDGKLRARENVVHKAGLFQGRLGFERAIVLLEEGCEKFSNIHGLNEIRFPKNKISSEYEKIRQVLEREGLVPKT
jgi:predicted nucleotide-binding protein